MKKCWNASRYQGVHPPRCNHGVGCDECRATYLRKHPEASFPHVTSDWTFLDIKNGRAALRKIVGDGPQRDQGAGCNVPVLIEGVIIDAMASADDGVSQEFTVQVRAVTLGAPQPKKAKGHGTRNSAGNNRSADQGSRALRQGGAALRNGV